ncbi:hypothetical protein QJS10_CPB12g01088 [Acorus calamus]|uniref:Endopeptidase S2P n=1 Tax=Acorus calamus TaxID=4465 RepID=A0AAV9DJJ7_ACOCL|nr:hypothetical protein QJS10_CPB12g01088 [Acorus calamus]
MNWLFGISFPGLSVSLVDIVQAVFTTLISIAVHEFGHAVAAASEGVQIEYIALFLALLFPGALVCLDDDLLQSLPKFSLLRIYCAGIWHNVMLCAGCGLSLCLLPLIFHPFYVNGEHPMVLSAMSPFSDFLSRGDVIMTLDGSPIHHPQEWISKMSVDLQKIQNSSTLENSRFTPETASGKGYCVPNPWIEESKTIQQEDELVFCPGDLTAFMSTPCPTSGGVDDNYGLHNFNSTTSKNCFDAKDVVRLKKCGNGWTTNGADYSNCSCNKGETCLSPVQIPGTTWLEITFANPYSSECQQIPLADSESSGDRLTNCSGTFVFIGDVRLAHSVQLSAYQPRWAFTLFAAGVPNMMEKMLTGTFHVSATLAFFNSLPVFLLDGESILEVSLCYITWLDPRMRRRILRFCLLVGTFLAVLALWKIIVILFTVVS